VTLADYLVASLRDVRPSMSRPPSEESRPRRTVDKAT
jgi:hypothetical protein